MLERNKISLSLAILVLATLAVFQPVLAIVMIVGSLFAITVYRWPLIGVIATILATVLGEYGRIELAGISLLALDVITPTVLLIWILRKLIKKESFRLNRSSFLLLAFWIISILSLLVGSLELSRSETVFAAQHLIRFLFISGIFFVTHDVSSKLKALSSKLIINFLLFTGLLLAFAGFLLFQQIPDFAEAGLAAEGWDPHIGRLTSTWLDPNFVAGAFAFLLAFAGARFLIVKKSAERPWTLILASILLVALLLTYSRSGLLALGVAGLVLGVIKSRKLLIAMVIIAVLGIIVSPRLSERLGELSQSAGSLVGESQQVLDPTAQLRTDSWREGLHIWKANPLLGTGYGAYKFHQNFADEDSHAATGSDSSLLNVAATTGIVGLIIYILFLVSLFQAAWKNREDAIGLGFLAATAGLLVHSIFVNSLFFPPMMLYLFVAGGLLQARRKEGETGGR